MINPLTEQDKKKIKPLEDEEIQKLLLKIKKISKLPESEVTFNELHQIAFDILKSKGIKRGIMKKEIVYDYQDPEMKWRIFLRYRKEKTDFGNGDFLQIMFDYGKQLILALWRTKGYLAEKKISKIKAKKTFLDINPADIWRDLGSYEPCGLAIKDPSGHEVIFDYAKLYK